MTTAPAIKTEHDFIEAAHTAGYSEPVEKSLEPGRFNATHTHDVDLYLYIREGQLTVGAADWQKTCGPGDTVEVLSIEEHTETAGPEGASFLVCRR